MAHLNAHEEQKSKVLIKDIPAEGYVKALVLDIRTAIKLTKAVSLLDKIIIEKDAINYEIEENGFYEVKHQDKTTVPQLVDLKEFVEEVVSALEK